MASPAPEAGETAQVAQASRNHAFFVTAMLGFVLLATAGLLTVDFLEMRGSAAASVDRRTGPVLMRPPSDGDQVRPYLPRARPVAPGRMPPDGVEGPSISETAPMTFVRKGDMIRAEGTIAAGTVAKFDLMVDILSRDDDADATTLELHSPGGMVAEAMDLARRVREEGLFTRISADGYCASSCPLIFAAGVERIADGNGWVGVHRVYVDPGLLGSIDDGIGHAQAIAAEAQDLLHGFGVDPMVWTHAMRTPKDQLYFFTADELTELRLATAVE